MSCEISVEKHSDGSLLAFYVSPLVVAPSSRLLSTGGGALLISSTGSAEQASSERAECFICFFALLSSESYAIKAIKGMLI